MTFFNQYLTILPLYAEAIIKSLVDQRSSKSFDKRLRRAMRKFLRHHVGKYMTDAKFALVFTNDFIDNFIKSSGLDIVGAAQEFMVNERATISLGSYPLTWTDAIALALRNMSWKWHSSHMTWTDFDAIFPMNLFMTYVQKERFDTL